jgi:predicted small lipoprotein YifL
VTKPAIITRRTILPVTLAALFVLAGCGIKGPLELPADAQVSAEETKQAKQKGKVAEASKLPGYQVTKQQQKAAKGLGRPIKPDEPFFLDSLLK